MRNNGLATISENTEYPYNGTGIYINGKTISYESCSWRRRKAFVNFSTIKTKMKFRRAYRKEAKLSCEYNMENLFRMRMERVETITNEIIILLKETRTLLLDIR